MEFGKTLKVILSERKLPVTELSRRTGIPASSLYAAIRRDGNMKLTSMANIADALGVEITDLYQINNKIIQNDLTCELAEASRNSNQKERRDMYRDIQSLLNGLSHKGLLRALDYITDLSRIPDYNEGRKHE